MQRLCLLSVQIMVTGYYVDKTDIDEIIDEHLVNGRVVERLKLSDHA